MIRKSRDTLKGMMKMKTKLALMVIVVLVPSLQIAGGIAETAKGGPSASPSSQTNQTALKYNFDYSCNGERV